MVAREETRFYLSSYINYDVISETTYISDYLDSFNMIFGCSNTTVDLFDNPYINIKLYNIDETYSPSPVLD